VREVNLDRLREDLGDFDRYLASLGHYLKAELTRP